jgi:hypothetical protein
MKRANLGLFCGAMLTACGPSLPAAEFAKIQNCDPDVVDVRPLTPASTERYAVQGCGKNLEIQCWDGKCVSPAYEVQRRHAREYGCLPSAVTAVDREEGYFIADGCGHRANYQCRFDPLLVARCEAER